jgi:hypothetical protein
MKPICRVCVEYLFLLALHWIAHSANTVLWRVTAVYEYCGLPGRWWIFIISGAIFKTMLRCFTSVLWFCCVCEFTMCILTTVSVSFVFWILLFYFSSVFNRCYCSSIASAFICSGLVIRGELQVSWWFSKRQIQWFINIFIDQEMLIYSFMNIECQSLPN